jgi:hypothetical protein
MNGSDAAPRIQVEPSANWQPFCFPALIDAPVSAMVERERTVARPTGAEEFRMVATTLVTTLIVGFGVRKALANLALGHRADGRQGGGATSRPPGHRFQRSRE